MVYLTLGFAPPSSPMFPEIHPSYLLLLSPGGRLRPGEGEAEGLKRKLLTKLSPPGGPVPEWEVRNDSQKARKREEAE